MKILPYCIVGSLFMASTACFGQIDIFQSDAYSVEEMCAREAEQDPVDYADAYDVCIEKNQDNPMYQTAHNDTSARDADDGSWDSSEQPDSFPQDEGYQDFSQGQVRY